jgi:hypothetical protein
MRSCSPDTQRAKAIDDALQRPEPKGEQGETNAIRFHAKQRTSSLPNILVM